MLQFIKEEAELETRQLFRGMSDDDDDDNVSMSLSLRSESPKKGSWSDSTIADVNMAQNGIKQEPITPDKGAAKKKRYTKSRVRSRSPSEITRLKKLRRSKANDRERNRMHMLNNGLEKLRGVLPTFPEETKLTKIETLRYAYNYIWALQHAAAVLDNDDEEVIDTFKNEGLSVKIGDITVNITDQGNNIVPNTPPCDRLSLPSSPVGSVNSGCLSNNNIVPAKESQCRKSLGFSDMSPNPCHEQVPVVPQFCDQMGQKLSSPVLPPCSMPHSQNNMLNSQNFLPSSQYHPHFPSPPAPMYFDHPPVPSPAMPMPHTHPSPDFNSFNNFQRNSPSYVDNTKFQSPVTSPAGYSPLYQPGTSPSKYHHQRHQLPPSPYFTGGAPSTDSSSIDYYSDHSRSPSYWMNNYDTMV